MKASKGRKTVLHLIETTELGGAENVLINIACGIKRVGYHSIVCLRKEGALSRELIQRGVETHVLQEEGLFDIQFLMNLVRMAIREKVSLIHAHEFLMSLYASIVGLVLRLPSVVTLHGKFYYHEKWRRRTALLFLARVSQLVCVSEDLRNFVSEKIGIPKNRIISIHNGIDTRIFSKNNSGALIKDKFGIRRNQKVVGTVANLSLPKGHIYLLRAIRIVIQTYPNVVFLFVGKGDQEKTLREEAHRLSICDYVKFLGFRSDVPDLLNLMDIFVLPSLSECLPISVLEAMALSIPVVVTDVGGVREIIKDQEAGYIVPPTDSVALADKISLLLKDRLNARSIGLRGSQIIEEKFSIQTMLTRYQDLYKSLL